MNFQLFVALRYLRAKRKQTLVSVISAISVLGIAAGVMALVIALALSTGFREVIQAKIVGATSHVNLLRLNGAPVAGYEELLGRLEKLPHVTGGAPAIFIQVFIQGPARGQGAVLKGVDPSREARISDFFEHIIEGDAHALEKAPAVDPEAPPQPENVLIGRELARALGAHVGDTLRLMVPRGHLTPMGMVAGLKPFRVGGIFESGLWDFDANWAYTSMRAAARLAALD